MEALMADPAVQDAGRTASRFNMDPIDVLSNGGDEFISDVRTAAARVVAEDERKQAEDQERKAKSGRGSKGRKR